METIEEIRTYIKKKKKQGFEGYQDMVAYFKKFSPEQLDYLETTFNANIGSFERLLAYRDIAVLAVAIIAMFTDVLPDSVKENWNSLALLLAELLLYGTLCLTIYMFLNYYPSKQINIDKIALEIIEKVKPKS